MKKALIVGISGQDGSYLGRFLLEKGYEIIGMLNLLEAIRFLGARFSH